MNENLDHHFLDWIWKGITGLLTFLTSALGAIVWWLFRRQSARIDAMEEKMAHAITRPEVMEIVADVKAEFKDEHRDIKETLEHNQQAIMRSLESITARIDGVYVNGNGKRRR